MIRPSNELSDRWRDSWRLERSVTYLNHGSFGPPPNAVRQQRERWQRSLDEQPMEFFVRRMEKAWFVARRTLAEFICTESENLALVENATVGMNIVAGSVKLAPGDEVVLTNHEYGAVHRIWERACREAGTSPPVVARLPEPMESHQQLVDMLFASVTSRTRLIVVSHITSPTALIMPIEQICRQARHQGVPVCVDGPHAAGQLDLNLGELACDYYTASCHKWLCAPFGSGFLYVTPNRQGTIRPPQLSWGRLMPDSPTCWSDEFLWSGTRDPSALLSIPSAVQFFQEVGWSEMRQYAHNLARYAQARLMEMVGKRPLATDFDTWHGFMAHVPLPPGNALQLQTRLWETAKIEVPIVSWNDRRWIRVSCHLYNTTDDVDYLLNHLSVCLDAE